MATHRRLDEQSDARQLHHSIRVAEDCQKQLKEHLKSLEPLLEHERTCSRQVKTAYGQAQA